MIYKNYFELPDGAYCRPKPVNNEVPNYDFSPKESWVTERMPVGYVANREWQTKDKTITITESEFDHAHYRVGLSHASPNAMALKNELFK